MRLSIVLTINGIYTKPGILGHRPVYRLSIIGPIVAISWLYFASVYSTICIKSVVIAYKNSYKQPLYFGIPGVVGNHCQGLTDWVCVWSENVSQKLGQIVEMTNFSKSETRIRSRWNH